LEVTKRMPLVIDLFSVTLILGAIAWVFLH
jgi:hypothetical protein